MTEKPIDCLLVEGWKRLILNPNFGHDHERIHILESNFFEHTSNFARSEFFKAVTMTIAALWI
jgi:hypothetical protein